MPRHPDPHLEQRILDAASRLWARGGEKALTMRAVAQASRTTTPTVYERYRDRDDLLRALRFKTRAELFAAISQSRTLRQAVQRHIDFALAHSHAYEVLFDGVAQPPSLHEPWPTFNFVRERVAERLGGTPRQHTRVMLSIWCLMHGTAMLIIRGGFEDALRTQTVHACMDAIDAILDCAARNRGSHSGPAWPSDLVLGEGRQSRVGSRVGAKSPKGAEANKKSTHAKERAR